MRIGPEVFDSRQPTAYFGPGFEVEENSIANLEVKGIASCL